MFEILLTIVFASLILLLKNYVFLRAFLFLALLGLLWPSFYSMVKGAPFVPSAKGAIDVMLKFGGFEKGIKVYELGCGDGRVMRAIAGKDAEMVGYEFAPATYLYGRVRHFLAGGGGEMRYGDFWKQDYSDADVLVCFLLVNTMGDFKKKIWPKLKKGTKVISNHFSLPGVKAVKEESGVKLYVK